MGRKIFRHLVDQTTARNRFYSHLDLTPSDTEYLPLVQALDRVNATDIFSDVDVPPFDRAAMDGFAVIASDTIGAEETEPITLEVIGDVKAGYVFDGQVDHGQCVEIATGAPMPAGADAVVMVEYTTRTGTEVEITRAVTPAENTMSAGTDIQSGERIIPTNRILTSRELAVLAAIGREEVEVFAKPQIGVFSSGDEIVPPGTELTPGKLYDINSTAIITSILENGGAPEFLGIIKDDRSDIKVQLATALNTHEIVLISGGTSAGMGDMLYEVIDELGEPGLLVHGVKVKPGKPTILAVCDGVPIVGLPGYPASALSILQLFVIPLIRQLAGLPPEISSATIKAKINQRLKSAEGRYEFKPMYLFKGIDGWIAYPVPGGSGAITSVALADGFVQIPENTHFIPANSDIEVHLISGRIKPPAIQVIGSHDIALAMLQKEFEQKYPNLPVRLVGVGSSGGVTAVRRGEAHMAGVHLLDPDKGYNEWITENEDVTIVPGFYRMQGLIIPEGNPKNIQSLNDLTREDVKFINRNIGSGTRILFDLELERNGINSKDIQGYDKTTRSHTSAAQTVRSGHADVTMGIQVAAESKGLDFIEIQEEEYDLVVANKYLTLDAVEKFVKLLGSDDFKQLIVDLPGYRPK